ncbi:inactive receptor kinase [Pyrus ussuriensis x Pyrus communis]|uniref:Inactive receptor kinase n=1 Tax=Pyrus ussuriensis x Pyrus communis TaxID=2448454 RepID=A0A5N5I9Z5_9ROSA|nr:inactive receptor kinase [Pyrus ussuriensis x Pyrus communis]
MQEDEVTALKDRRCRGVVVEVGLGFEGKEGNDIGGWEEEVWRWRWEWIICAGWMACMNGREGKCGI